MKTTTTNRILDARMLQPGDVIELGPQGRMTVEEVNHEYRWVLMVGGYAPSFRWVTEHGRLVEAGK